MSSKQHGGGGSGGGGASSDANNGTDAAGDGGGGGSGGGGVRRAAPPPSRGCEVILHAADKMGNLCSYGGAVIQLDTFAKGDKERSKAVTSHVVDRHDGSYLLSWRSTVSGTFEAHILIDGCHIMGSPSPLKLVSDTPDLSQAKLSLMNPVYPIEGICTHE